MKTALISMYFDPNAMGVRLLSAVLKRAMPEDKVDVVLLSHKFKPPRMDFDLETEEDLSAIKDFFSAGGYDAVCISLMTNYYDRAVQLTQAIREVSSAKIIWGGIHATLRPEECLRHADMVFVGEAEIAFPQVMERLKNSMPIDIPGVYTKVDGVLLGVGVCTATMDLNELPHPDFDIREHFVFSTEKRRIIGMTEEDFKKSDWMFTDGKPFYRIMTARGCSQSCSYCINSRYRHLLGMTGKAVRKRSVESVIGELEEALKLDIFKKIMFIDDDICLRSVDWLKEFAEEYRAKISLPFACQVTAGRVNEEKVRYLKHAGVTGISMGIQTGSDRLNFEIFNRKISSRHIVEASNIIAGVGGISLGYDLIVRNPYETLADKIETALLLLRLPLPYHTKTYALTFFPGMPLTQKAQADGLLTSQQANSIYDFEGSEEEQEWIELLAKFPKAASKDRAAVVARLECEPPQSVRELIRTVKGGPNP